MSHCWSRLLFIGLSAGLAFAAPGCSCGDDDGGGDRPDARVPGDSAPDIDADTEDGLLRSGTIAVTEARISNTIGAGDPWSGAVVRVSFSDATTGNAPPPVDGFESNINGCLIQVWDVGTHEGSDPVDEGIVSVVGTSNGPFGCAFVNADVGYACQSATPAVANGPATGATLAANTLTFVGGGTTVTAEMQGMYVRLTSFDDAVDGKLLPILAVSTEADSLTVGGTGGADLGTGDADATFSTFVGVGPIPAPGGNFLGGAGNDFTVQKEAGEVVPAIDEDFSAHGQGFTLTSDAGNGKYLPHNLPTDGSAATFECADADACGAEGAGGIITAIVVNGETTDATVGPLDPGAPMPDPETQYATFACSFFVSGDPPYSATLSAEAMQVLLDTGATRIQTTVGRYRGSILADDAGETSTIILQGHAFLGWTDIE